MTKSKEGSRISETLALTRIIGTSPVFRHEIEKLPKIARSAASVLIRGETGTGKELIARTLHHLSDRSSGPFVPVNCGALPLDLVESELFGAEKGAFTGAVAVRSGLVEEADQGTLFLDEVDSLPLPSQVKLLRFLQDGEYRRLGSNKSRRVDARVVSATNSDFTQLVASGSLRPDLFYRLNVLQVCLPPLRDRREDILLLARHFLRKHHSAKEEHKSLSGDTERLLLSHSWQGNVRELEHLIQRALVLSGEESRICPSHMELDTTSAGHQQPMRMDEAKAQVLKRFEKRYLEKMLALTRGNISRAARTACRSRRGFFGLIKKHGIDASRFRECS